MPVLDAKKFDKLRQDLIDRYGVLINAFKPRELKSNREGVSGRGHWVHPETKRATLADDTDLRMAIDGFKTILSEIRRLK